MHTILDLWRNYQSDLSLENLRTDILAHPENNKETPIFIGEILLIALLCEDWEAAEVCLSCLKEQEFKIDDAFDFGAIGEYFDAWPPDADEREHIEFASSSEEPSNGLKWLLANGAEMTRRSMTFPIHYAARNSLNECLKILIEHGASVDLIDPDDNQTPLMEAIMSKNLEGVMLLVKSGAQSDHINRYGENIFDLASKCGDKEILRFINSKFYRE